LGLFWRAQGDAIKQLLGRLEETPMCGPDRWLIRRVGFLALG
jgi:hypothetical protein